MKIIICSVIAVILSLVSTHFLFNWLTGYSPDPRIEIAYSNGQIVKLFIVLLVYYSALFVLPLFVGHLLKRFAIKSIGTGILALELACLFFCALCSPPDLMSIITFYIICQPIVIVNAIAINRNLR